jgi:hypothetical protein
MSDGSGGFLNGIDLSHMSDQDWSDFMNKINTPNLDLSGGGTFGMGDRGLGTTDPSLSDGTGTLSPDEISLLNAGGVGFQNGPGAVQPASGGLGSILKALGLGDGSGGMNIPMLLSLLAAGAGGLMNKSATSKATDQILSSIKDANTQATNILGPGGGAQQALQPYLTGGAAAFGNAGNMIYKPAGSQFSGPVNARVNLPPVSLASIMRASALPKGR